MGGLLKPPPGSYRVNSVKTSSFKKSIQSELHSIGDSSVIFCPVDIFNALKNVRTGKACGVDGLAAEQFIYADAIMHNTFIIVIELFYFTWLLT